MIEKHLLFAVLAFESELLDLAQLTAACRAWAADKSKPIADLLVERGWITAEDLSFVEKVLARKLAKHQHDPRVTLNAVTRGDICDAIKEIDDPDIQQSLSSWPSSGPVWLETIGETLADPELPKSRYTWVSEVGKGGLGKIWLARDNDLAREVALKELKPGSTSSEAVRRLIKEAQITGQLQHPNIVPVYEVNRGSRPFYTMKLVKGETLLQVILRHHQQRRAGKSDPLTEQRLMSVFLNVCDAISYAHSRGIIHRDLKPQNVVLGDYGEAIVLDWGLARRVNATDEDTFPVELTDDACTDATQAGQKLGTPAYMSPEQASGRVDLIDHRTDIYGLGAILFQILTGEPPHRAAADAASLRADADSTGPNKPSSLAALLHSIATGETPHVCDLDNPLPEELDAICAKAMSKSRDERYQSAKDLKSAMLEFQVHKESIDLAASAAVQLERAKQSDNYQNFNSALFGFEESLRQWPANKTANIGIEETLIAYAQTALKHGDLDLGLSMLDANESDHAETRTMLLTARKKRDADVRNAKWGKVTKWAIPLMTPFIVLLAVAAKFQVNFQEADRLKNLAIAETKKAEDERRLSDIAKQQAEEAKQRAEELRVFHDKKKEEAVKEAAEANFFKLMADMAKQKAEEQSTNALVAMKQAEVARADADKAMRMALSAALVAKNEKAKAEEDKNKAEFAEKKAAYKAGLSDASRVIYEGNYKVARDKLNQLKENFGNLCGPEWDLLMKVASAPQAVSMFKPVESIGLSRDGRKLVSGDSAGHIVVWSIDADGKILTDQPIRHMEVGSRLRVVAMSSDGQLIAAAGDDGLIRVWSLNAAAKQQPIVLKGHELTVNTLKFSEDGKRLASGSDDRTVRLWSLDSATVIVDKRTSFPVTSLDWSRDGTILVAVTRALNSRNESPNLFRPLRLISVPKIPPKIRSETGTCTDMVSPPIAEVPIAEAEQSIAEVEDEPPGFSRAYSWKVVTKGNTVTLQQLCTYDGPFSDKWALRSYALKRLRTRDGPPDQERGEPINDGEWDAFVFQALREGSRFHTRWDPTAIVLTSDGRFAVCNGFESEIYLWQTNVRGANVHRIGSETSYVVNSVNLGSHSNRIESVRSLAFTSDDSRLLAAGDDGSISIWSREVGDALPSYKRSQVIYGHGGPVRGCLPLPQSPDLIVSGSYDNHIHVLDLKTYFKTREWLEPPIRVPAILR